MLFGPALATVTLSAITTIASPSASVANNSAALTPDRSVAYQLNPYHDGAASGSTLVAPLMLKWSVAFPAGVSYPLIVDSRIYVTVASNSGYGTTLHALDVQTGQTLWSQPIAGTYYWSTAAYDDGQVFVLNFDGLVRAFDAGDGTPLWEFDLPGQYAFSSAPTAVDGVIYAGGAGSGGTVYALDEATQTVLWTQGVANGDQSSPVVTDRTIFVSYACPQTYALDRLTGALKWHHAGSCSGGGGKNVVYHRGRVYVRDVFFATDNGSVLDSATGDLLGSFASTPAPAFDADRGYFVYSGRLKCRSVSSGQTVWRFAGDGALATAPIVANGSVYIGATSGNLYALDAASGSLLWSTNVGTSIAGPDEQNVSHPLTGLGVGSGVLVVPAGNSLFVYGN